MTRRWLERLAARTRSAADRSAALPPAELAEGDILAEERRSWRRFLMPGYWLAGRVGVAALVGLLVVGLVWFEFLRGDRDADFVRADSVEVPVAEDAGRALFAGEYSTGEAYGEPLGLGEHGRPVVRHYVTGQVRELTPVELEYDKYDQYVSAGHRDVVFNPGPRGWGMWWRDDSARIAELRRLYFSRQGWRARQEAELERAVGAARELALLALRFDLESWETGSGFRLARRAGQVSARYDYRVRLGGWQRVPGQWVCDSALESDLNLGVTPGCPTLEYGRLLREAWIRVGVVLDRLELVGGVASWADAMELREFRNYQGGLNVGYRLLELERDLGRLEEALAALERRSYLENLPIVVVLYAD